MSFHLLQFGATPRRVEPEPAARLRAPGVDGSAAPSEKVFKVSTARPVEPAQTAVDAQEKARRQVMSERGYDMLSMYKLSSQDRIRAEAGILAETALRTRQAPPKKTGAFVDLRV